MYTVQLKNKRDTSLRRHHPWIFSGAIASARGKPGFGDTVKVLASNGDLLGVGAYSPASQIQVRMWRFEDGDIDEAFFHQRLTKAIEKRRAWYANTQRNAYRLVFGESDGLPGLVVDQFNDFLVCQFMFAGVERWKTAIVSALQEITACRGIYERSDVGSRDKEGLLAATGVLSGENPPETIVIDEYGVKYRVDIVKGQKTGFYLDQAENRRIVARLCSNKTVLNCFSYTGGFSVAALLENASHVTSVDSSGPALKTVEQNIADNGIDAQRHTTVEANVFHLLRDWQSEQTFDLIILDPPKFADTKTQVQKAARAYKDLALQAVKLLNPNGLLVNFTCSGGMDLSLFQKITADAFLDAGRQGEIIQYLHQGPDHPIGLAFPEAQYLKGLVSRVN